MLKNDSDRGNTRTNLAPYNVHRYKLTILLECFEIKTGREI
jgi:hypothetical protein